MSLQSMKSLVLYALLLPGKYATAHATPSDSVRLNKERRVATVQYGVASYYHDKFEGRRTHNDEIFSQQKLTAACNNLPMNCWVRVTNTRNKRTVIVWINDRMHWRNPRLIDLSKAAATKLGYIGRGLTRVKVQYLGRKKPPELHKEKHNK